MYSIKLSITQIMTVTTAIFFLIVLSTTACSDDNFTGATDDSDTGEVGIVEGVVTATNGETPIQGARVWVKAEEGNSSSKSKATNSNTPETTTDIEGRYTLEGVPVGQRTIAAQRGVFYSEFNVDVETNSTVEAPAAALEPTSKLAYISGSFDSMENILVEQLGMEIGVHIEEIERSDLESIEALADYSMIFLNCGSSILGGVDDEVMGETLRQFISTGGAVYASDLELPVLWSIFPDYFPSGNSRSGGSGTIEASVTYSDLQQFIGKSDVEIAFNLGGWRGVDESTMSTNVETLLRGDYSTYEDAPLAVAVEHGDGALIFTSFHNTGAPTFDQRQVLIYFVYAFGNPGEMSAKMPIAKHNYPKMVMPPAEVHDHEHKLVW